MLGHREVAAIADAISQLLQWVDRAAAIGGRAHALNVIRQMHNEISILTETKTPRGEPRFSLEFVGPPLAGFECAFEVDDDAFQFSFLGSLRYEGFSLHGSIPVAGAALHVQADAGFRSAGFFKAWLARQSGLRAGVTWRARMLRDVFVRAGAVDPTRMLGR